MPSAKGLYLFNRMRKTGTWRVESKPENEWGNIECAPIIPEDLWNQANQIIEEQLKSWKKAGKPSGGENGYCNDLGPIMGNWHLPPR